VTVEVQVETSSPLEVARLSASAAEELAVEANRPTDVPEA